VRVIGGVAKGRRLLGAGRGRTRPIPDNVKKSLFDILTPYIPESRCLDLFAGTGAIGIEALSRGAQWVTFVECEPAMIRVINGNLDVTGFKAQAEVIKGDVRRIIQVLHGKDEVSHIIFVDPPYGHGLVPVVLDILSIYNLLDPGGIVMARHERRQEVPKILGSLELARQERYGDTVASFYTTKR
jgi:16S rRNA (guanine966-N2)-methyltransferase